ncbi:helix-turn-helix transcriptional regulator [Aquamicrobium segne]|uniref:Helix-turn-helix transcriptional regulator n=1 Tax=Aquamicrobium segne TaxID=469547 RepID=A0ABW0GU52_9HYPH
MVERGSSNQLFGEFSPDREAVGGDDTVGSWREKVDSEIDSLGWREATRIEQPGEDVTIYMIDVLPPRDIVFRPKGPATFSLSIFLDGVGALCVDGAKPFEFHGGSAVLFACDRMTGGENHVQAGKRLRIVDIRVEKALLERLGGISLARLGGAVISDHSLPEQDIYLIGFKASPKLLGVASSLLKCNFEEGPVRRTYLYSKAIEALGIGLDTLVRASGGPVLRPLKKEELRKLELAVRLIEESYNDDWTIARLAKTVGLNERRLKEGFRIAIGKSVHTYLRSTRMNAAAALLASGTSVTETAMAVGFDSLSHFSKAFRTEKGVLPSQYRESEQATGRIRHSGG